MVESTVKKKEEIIDIKIGDNIPPDEPPPKFVRRLRKKIGDVIEVPTKKGLAYIQYTHEHKKEGSLIRVLQGFFKKRPSKKEIQELVDKPHRFHAFCQIYISVNMGRWERVGNFAVPEFAQKFPVFRARRVTMETLFKKKEPKTAKWDLWDGERSWYVGHLTEEELTKHPDKAIPNAQALISRIETGMSLGVNIDQLKG